MTSTGFVRITTSVVVAIAAGAFSASAFADVDAAAAKKLARKDHCLRCHAVAKKKEGPSYQAVAYKYKGQPDAAEKLYQHLTSGEKVKLSDGHEENHKIAKAKDDAEIRNLIAWILAQ
ncbi:MAG TPA: c-type cytochrome [Rhodocyclaceae bacterium]